MVTPTAPAIRVAIYAGSFDPITNGHVWVIEQGARLFDRLIVAVGKNAEKSSTFTAEEKIAMIRQATAHLPQVEVDLFDREYLVNYAARRGATHILRGIRNPTDYGFERTLRHINSDIARQITTVFLMPPRELSEVSSSTVKALIGPAGWQEVVRTVVPPNVAEIIEKKYAGH